MPTYKITDPKTGKIFKLSLDHPPSQSEIKSLVGAETDRTNAPKFKASDFNIGSSDFDIPTEDAPLQAEDETMIGLGKGFDALSSGIGMLGHGIDVASKPFQEAAVNEKNPIDFLKAVYSGKTYGDTPTESLGTLAKDALFPKGEIPGDSGIDLLASGLTNLAMPGADVADPRIRAAMRAGTGFGTDMARDPLSYLGAGAAKLNPQLASAIFTGMGAKGTIEGGQNTIQNAQEKGLLHPDTIESGIETGLSGAMTGLGAHGLMEGKSPEVNIPNEEIVPNRGAVEDYFFGPEKDHPFFGEERRSVPRDDVYNELLGADNSPKGLGINEAALPTNEQLLTGNAERSTPDYRLQKNNEAAARGVEVPFKDLENYKPEYKFDGMTDEMLGKYRNAGRTPDEAYRSSIDLELENRKKDLGDIKIQEPIVPEVLSPEQVELGQKSTPDIESELGNLNSELQTRMKFGVYDKMNDTNTLESKVDALEAELSRRNSKPQKSEPQLQQSQSRIQEPNLISEEPLEQTSLINAPKEGEYIPPEPPTDVTKFEPEKPIEPKKSLGHPSRLDRAKESVRYILNKIDPELALKARAYEYDVEVPTSRVIYKIRKATGSLDKTQQKALVEFLDKGTLSQDPQVMQAGNSLRSLLNEVRTIAKHEGVLSGELENYFPHKFKDGTWEHDVSPSMNDNLGRRNPNLEKSRKGGGNYRRDLGVLDEYFSDAYRRISESRHLGKSLEKVLNEKYAGDPEISQYISKSFKRLTGREESTVLSRAAGKARHIQALSDLAMSSPLQLGQEAHIVSRGGLLNTVKAAKIIALDRSGQTNAAIRSGALWPSLSHETARAYGSTGFMWGTPTVDAAMRVHASVVGRLLAQDASSGGRSAIRELKRLGFDVRRGTRVSQYLEDAISKKFTEDTNFRTGVLDLPLWSTSPMGKLLTQYTTFMYRHTHFVKDLFRDAFKGNVKPLAAFLATGVLMGEGINDLRAVLKGRGLNIEGNETEKDWENVLRNNRITAKRPLARALQNLATIGGVGIFQALIERASSRDFPENMLGPVIGTTIQGLKSIKEGVGNVIENKKDIGESLRPLGKFALEQVPGYGYDLSSKVFPKKSKKTKSLFDKFDFSVKL